MTHGIRLQSGGIYNFLYPEIVFTTRDLAHNLSQINRFNGSCDYPYSVAQHAVNCSRIAAAGFECEALHHDDAEALYGDMTTWLKRRCPDYQILLKEGEDLLADWRKLPRQMSHAVKTADLQMLMLEKNALFANHGETTEAYEHLVGVDVTGLADLVDLTRWTAEQAEEAYMERYAELWNR